MRKSTRTKAEEQFAEKQKKQDKVREESDRAQRERAELTAELRARRLAKEEEEKADAAKRGKKRSR